VGTLCVLDRQPRDFDATQTAALAALARPVVAQFELRRGHRELAEAAQALRADRNRLREVQTRLKRSETRMALVLKGANDGWWDSDLVSGQRYHSPRGWAMLGYENDDLPYDGELWERLVHPEDVPRVKRLLAEAICGDAEHYNAEMRLRHTDGHYIPVLSRGYIRGEHTPAGLLRRPHRAAEPAPAGRPHRAGAGRSAAQRAGRRAALHRPRQLQADQRRARPPGGRPPARAGGAASVAAAARR
jgi:PAS domain-containing protein